MAAAYTRADVTDLLVGDVANAVSSCAPVHGVVDGGRRISDFPAERTMFMVLQQRSTASMALEHGIGHPPASMVLH